MVTRIRGRGGNNDESSEKNIFLIINRNSIRLPTLHSQNKINHHSSEERHREDRWPKAIIKATLASLADTLGAPMEGDEGVYHGGHGDDGEQGGGDAADAVTEIQ